MKHKHQTRFNYILTDYITKIRSCFHPLWLVGLDFTIIVMAAVVLGSVMHFSDNIAVENITLAVATGIIASATLAGFTELASNYRRNAVRNLTLSEVWSFLARYEFEVETRCGQFDIKKSNRDFEVSLGLISSEGEAETGDEEPDEPLNKTRVGAVLDVVPKAIPMLQDVYDNHAGELTSNELISLKSILTTYGYIATEVRMVLAQKSDLMFGEPYEAEMQSLLEAKFPAVIMDSLREVRVDLAMDIWKEELEKAAGMIVQGGEWRLQLLGIELSDERHNSEDEDSQLEESLGTREVSDAEDEDEEDEARLKEAFLESMLEHSGTLISMYLQDIDKEMKTLERMVGREPGFRELQKYSYRKMREYPRGGSGK